MHGCQPRGGPNLAGEIQMRRGARTHSGNHMGEAFFGVDMSTNDIDEVDLAGIRQPSSDLEALGLADASLELLIADHSDSHDEIGSDPIADGVDHPLAEPHPIV